MKAQLGGNRLGSGGKMEVDLKTYNRSTHDLGYTWRNTQSPGTLVPFLCEVALPGDTFDITLDANVLTHPTVGPLFGSFKVQLDVFEIPIRLYNARLHNNQLNVGMNIKQVALPQLILASNITKPTGDNDQISPSCLLSYLGIRGLGRAADPAATVIERYFNAVPLLGYYEIFKNYYANKQETNAYVIHTDRPPVIKNIQKITINTGGVTLPDAKPTLPQRPATGPNLTPNGDAYVFIPAGATNRTDPNSIRFYDSLGNAYQWNQIYDDFVEGVINGGALSYAFHSRTQTPVVIVNWDYVTIDQAPIPSPTLVPFPLENIDLMRNIILKTDQNVPLYLAGNMNLTPYDWFSSITQDVGTPIQINQEGLAVKTYQSDLFNNWIQTEWIDGGNGIAQVTAVSTTSGSFTIDQLNLSKKVYDMLNRIALSGGSYNDYIESVYSTSRFRQAETPVYRGGLSKELVFQEVVSTAAVVTNTTKEGNAVLGQLAGKGTMSKKHKGGQIRIAVEEPSYIMGIVSLTPRLDYSQGNKWDVNLKTLDDLHKPALDEIGYQDLVTDQMAWWDTEIILNQSGGWFNRYTSLGKQPAWINYMTNVNQTRGNFAIQNNEMFMTLNRRYEQDTDGTIIDATTYIDPSKYNYIFAETSIDAMNFWVQLGVDMEVRRVMSAKVIPNL